MTHSAPVKTHKGYDWRSADFELNQWPSSQVSWDGLLIPFDKHIPDRLRNISLVGAMEGFKIHGIRVMLWFLDQIRFGKLKRGIRNEHFHRLLATGFPGPYAH